MFFCTHLLESVKMTNILGQMKKFAIYWRIASILYFIHKMIHHSLWYCWVITTKTVKLFFFPRFFFLEKTISLVANQLYWSSSLAYIFDLPSKSFSLVRHFFDSLFKKGWWYNSSIIDSNFIWKYSNMASSQYFVILMRQVLQQRC